MKAKQILTMITITKLFYLVIIFTLMFKLFSFKEILTFLHQTTLIMKIIFFFFLFTFISEIILSFIFLFDLFFYQKIKNNLENNNESLYDELARFIIQASYNKIGALITIENKDNLNNIIINDGILINGIVTKELLATIFYPNTALHDGAVIIKNNIIVAAHVMYNLNAISDLKKSNYLKAHGARHTAAMSVSTITDSVNILVSEETGEVSIIKKGEIKPITILSLAHIKSFLKEQF